jgi:archaellum component FlaC
MDQELVAFLEKQFGESAQQIARLREETAQQFASFREETAQQFASFREETAQQFAGFREETAQQITGVRGEITSFREETAQQITGVRGEITSFREETAQRFAETTRRFEGVEDSIRYTQITVEKMRGEIQLLAEGVSSFDEKLERVRTELKEEIGGVRDLLRLSYGDLNRRIG